MKKCFVFKGIGTSKIESRLYKKKELPKDILEHNPNDLVRIIGVNFKGEEFIDIWIEPDECPIISTALTSAFIDWKATTEWKNRFRKR